MLSKLFGATLHRYPEGEDEAGADRQLYHIADFLKIPLQVAEQDIVTVDTALAPGYGQLNDVTVESLRLAATTEGLVLDPVYTGKAFAGMVSQQRAGKHPAGANVLFLHTGGQPALFAYEPDISDALAIQS